MYIVIAFISLIKFPKYKMSTLWYTFDTQRQRRYYALNNFSRKKETIAVVFVLLEVYLRDSGNTELIGYSLGTYRQGEIGHM